MSTAEASLSTNGIRKELHGDAVYTATGEEAIIAVVSIPGGGIAITVPNAATIGPRKPILIKDESGSASTNPITITPAAGTIDGQASIVLATAYGSASIYPNGEGNWNVAAPSADAPQPDRYFQSFVASSGVIASTSAPTTLATMSAIDVLATESLVITASAVFNKDVTPGAVELIIEVDGVSVGNTGTSSDSVISNGSATASRTVQVKPAAGSRVVSIVGFCVTGDASLVAGGATVVARRVLA